MSQKNKFNDSSQKSTSVSETALKALAAFSTAAILTSATLYSCAPTNGSIKHREGIKTTENKSVKILKPAKFYKLSSTGLKNLMTYEGFVPHAYQDATKKAIGFGHNIKPGEKFPKEITIEQGIALLAKDLKEYEAVVKSSVTVQITQEHYDSLVSFSYNVGREGFRTSTLLKLLNKGRFEESSKEFDKWVFTRTQKGQQVVSDNLQERRNREEATFVKGNKKIQQFI